MIEIIKDTLLDGIKLLPFLFITYLIMEYLEHKTENKTTNAIKNAGKLGPLFGGILGVFPQCGFSAAAANVYAGKIITVGTLIAIFLSTSDEMLPILISESAPLSLIIKILLIKLFLGILFGFIIDIGNGFIKKFNKKENIINSENENAEDSKEAIGNICEHEHCDCEKDGIIKSAIKHTINIFIFILIITLLINILISWIGEDNLGKLILNMPVLGIAISCLIGLIPNCAGSVIITQLYLANLINFGTMIAGLLVDSGVGILILFRTNKNIKQNIKIITALYFIGIISGIIINLII